MSYCLNPNCQTPQNLEGTRFCQNCSSQLLLKDRYRAIQILGQGAMGQTLLAVDEDQPSQPYCVIKHFFPKDTGGNAKAASVGAHRLTELGKHPMIPDLWASFEQDGHQYLIQEYIDGVSVARELADAGSFSETQIRGLLKDLLPVLRFVHNHLTIHGDIKPENIIRRPSDKRPVLVDFGYGTKTLCGSAEYVAPEQTKGQAVASSDLYSLGVTCIHLLTQVSPFDLFDIKADTWAWRDYLKTPVSYQLGQILDKLIQRNPKQRYQSAIEVVKDLNSWMIPAPSIPQKRLAVSAVCGAAVAILLGTLSSRLPAPLPQTSFTTYETSVTLPEIDYSTPDLWQEVQPMRTLVGNSGPFWSVAVSPDGQMLASGSFDGTIQLWRLGTGEMKTILAGHSGAVWSVAISPDGQTLASSSEDKTVKLWNLRTGELENTLLGHSEAVFAVAFSPDGHTMATVSEDKTIELWNYRTGQLIRTLVGHSAEVQSVAFSPDGQTLVTGSTDGTVKLWNVRTGNLKRSLIGHSDAVWSVAISPDGQTLASGSWDRTIKIWDLQSGQMLNTFIGHSEQVQSVAFSPDGEMLASGDVSGTIKLWDMSTGTQMGTLKGHSAWVEVAFSPVGKTLVSGGFDDTIKLWSLCP